MAGTAPAGAAGGVANPCCPRITPPATVWNHASTDIGCVPVAPAAGYEMKLAGIETNWFAPFRLKACPTLPAANVVPFCSVPLLLPRESLAFPSAVYHATIPEGGGVHCCAWVMHKLHRTLRTQILTFMKQFVINRF